MTYYPILIPVKQHSSRCQNKNSMLLPILYKSMSLAGITDKCVVLCDSYEIAKEANKMGFNTWVEPQASIYIRTKNNDVENIFKSTCKSEYESMIQWKLWYLSLGEEERKNIYDGIEFDTKYCFLAPATQPFKHSYFYNRIYDNINKIIDLNEDTPDVCNVVASASVVPNRAPFDIHFDDVNDIGSLKYVNFDNDCKTRRGRDCEFKLNIDGTWYFIDMGWLEKNVIKEKIPETQNGIFWNKSGMYVVINNEQPTIDIDDENDMKQLLFMIKHFK